MAFSLRVKTASLSSPKFTPSTNATLSYPIVSLPLLTSSSLLPTLSFPHKPTRATSPLTVKASSPSSSPTVADPLGIEIKSVPTKPIEGQKTGTSGLRKKVKVFMEENYLGNWIQALFNSLSPEDFKNGILVLGG
ncbi:phosphoglucomutase [Actinidia rufa]|nr:phosphoglucomutase [Actinidia rufa]